MKKEPQLNDNFSRICRWMQRWWKGGAFDQPKEKSLECKPFRLLRGLERKNRMWFETPEDAAGAVATVG